MKVAVYHSNDDIRLEERKKPEINDGELLVKTDVCGICGTDVMEWYRKKKGPRVLGHEMTGEIIESKSDKFKVGQRVFVSHHVPCNDCKYCNNGNHTACETLHKGNYDPGGFSEFIRIPKVNVDFGTYVLPESVTNEEGSMIEPLACCIRAQRIINVKKGIKVLILGSGISGLMNIQIAKNLGAIVTATDIEDWRLKKAIQYGADKVQKADQAINEKFDKIILCTGAMPAVKQAFEVIDKKGTILLFAIPSTNIELPTEQFWRNEISLISSYGAAPVDLKESLNLIKGKKVDVASMVTHRLPMQKIQEGFQLVASAKESLKVLIKT